MGKSLSFVRCAAGIVLTKVTIAKKMTVPSDRAWEAISEIGRLDVWFPTIASCTVEGEGVGAHRYMTLKRGGDITDRIVDVNAAKRRLTYQRLRSPFPVSSYKGTVEVFESFDSRAIVVWTVDFESDPKDSSTVADALRSGIGAGVDGMERDLQTSEK
jgi:polyketide cyclase/dehydrase/lipid transport protein